MTKEQIMEYVKMAILVLIGIMVGALLQKVFGDEDKRSESVAIYITIPNSGNADAEITTKVGPEDNSTNNSNILPEVTVELENTEEEDEEKADSEENAEEKADSEENAETTSHQSINRDFDILRPCGYTSEQLKSVLSDDAHKEMIPYVDSILEAERTHGVNALYLMCKLGIESGWGKYESGKNNIGGWTNNQGGFKDFNSVDECIMHIAKNLSTSYKDIVGTRLEDVCKRYCPDEGYTELLLDIMTDMEIELETYA